jgi:putative protease
MRKLISRVKKFISRKAGPAKSKSKTKAKKTAAKKSATAKKAKPIGVVTHYYGDISVAVIKFKQPFKKGETVHFKGATSDFKEKIKSMQYDHKPVESAKKGQEVGVKVGDKVREGDEVYASE